MPLDPNQINAITTQISADAKMAAQAAGLIAAVLPQAALAQWILQGIGALAPAVGNTVIALAAKGDPTPEEIAALKATITELETF